MTNPDYPFIDIREELSEILKQHFNWFGIRQPDYKKPCSCGIANADGIMSPSKECTRCLSRGFLFTDYIIKGYSWLGVLGFEFPAGPGMISSQANHVIFKHTRPINKFDIVLELNQEPDTDKLITPFQIMRQYIVQDAKPIRLDDGKIEFYKCYLEERNINSYRPGEEGTRFKYQGNRSNDAPV